MGSSRLGAGHGFVSRLRRNLYRSARDLGDLEAAATGPGKVYGRSNRIVGKLLRGFGL
jgi:hypothetical protein